MTSSKTFLCLSLLLTALLLAAGCAGKGSDDVNTSGGIAGRLPPLPMDNHPPLRSGLAVTTVQVEGSQEYMSHGGLDSGTFHQLTSEPGELAWAVYRVDTGNETPLTLNIDVPPPSGNAFLGLADYATGAWDFSQPLGPFQSTFTLSADNVSPGGNIFFVVAAWDGEDVLVRGAAAEFEGPGLTPLYVTGHIAEGGGQPLAGVELRIPFNGGIVATTDGNGNFAFESLGAGGDFRVVPMLNGYSFNPPIVIMDLEDNVSGLDFTATLETLPEVVTYTAHMRPQVFQPVCMNCHNQAYAGLRRHGAPSNVNWDTYDGTTPTQKNRGFLRAIVEGTMPPAALGYTLNNHQRALFSGWEENGFPEN
jgi:hypothetical protein